MRRALLFSGQGSHKKGMGLDLIADRTMPGWRPWIRIHDALDRSCGLNITTVIRDDPGAVDVEGRVVRCPPSVMKLTFIAQPAMLTFHAAAHATLVASVPEADRRFDFIAGHSLGEYSALMVLGAIEPEKAATLVFRRGQIMTKCLEPLLERDPDDPVPLPLFAVNPTRAGLSQPDAVDPDGVVKAFIASIAKGASALFLSTLELVNHNCAGEQMVVAGDRVSLSALGKCLDPQWRATALAELGLQEADVSELASKAVAEAIEDIAIGVPLDPNLPIKQFTVPGSRQRSRKGTLGLPQYRTIDGGLTPLEEDLSGLSRQGDGRSGLKKKSWFIPLDLAIPFHSSALRAGVDDLHAEIARALPADDAAIDKALLGDGVPRWVTNLTGTVFDPSSAAFRADVRRAILGANIGQHAHHGVAAPAVIDAMLTAVDNGDTRGTLLAVMAMQLTRTVQWQRTMDTMRAVSDSTTAATSSLRTVEIAPVPTLTSFMNKHRPTAAGQSCAATAAGKCYPADARLLAAWLHDGAPPSANAV